MPRSTPWGPAQTSKEIGQGIRHVTTASHGGFFIPAKVRTLMPAEHRSPDGWYEEDCEWCYVAINFPYLFPDGTYEQAATTQQWLEGRHGGRPYWIRA